MDKCSTLCSCSIIVNMPGMLHDTVLAGVCESNYKEFSTFYKTCTITSRHNCLSSQITFFLQIFSSTFQESVPPHHFHHVPGKRHSSTMGYITGYRQHVEKDSMLLSRSGPRSCTTRRSESRSPRKILAGMCPFRRRSRSRTVWCPASFSPNLFRQKWYSIWL